VAELLECTGPWIQSTILKKKKKKKEGKRETLMGWGGVVFPFPPTLPCAD
jgi:hypothetical protein